ncbi:MAG: homocysteine S-methyltransferase family protein [Alphaproteobacteria bacterium]|nr:homocysteine S-methyltransferase family protein [Alphaproteobacteria bacterium]MBU6472735.1 homocysteine S-methyltransferase family protein [Alphaproteobacteria bacterium]MDE2012975.1 homocysteine S-methyltransferase family protein [Alphaproteobacteria bacterium]MDE2073738.1 homocysteine S-methyltransferase family protein [Alphaproteobacteria bacterium]
MKTILERVAEGEILISDGAMGTFLHEKGLGQRDCPESWCVSHPEVVREIADAYIAAGADMVETNSFGGSALRLLPHGMAGKARAFNIAAARIAREAIDGKGYVLGSVGPTAQLIKQEGGKATLEEFYQSFKEQVMALEEGGADAICIETMGSLVEAKEAVRAAKENTKLPVICTFTFDKKPRGFFTMMGATPEKVATELVAAGADVVGTNCGNGIVNMIEIVRKMRAAAPATPILVHANAGMPVVEDGKTFFKDTPEFMASQVDDLIKAGANIIGGCCGTTPAHIAAIAKTVRN